MKINAQWVKDNLKADIFNYDIDSVRYGIALTLITLSNADFIVLDAEVASWMTKILKEKENIVNEESWKDKYDDVGAFHNGFARVIKKIDDEYKWGCINIYGKEVVPCVYDSVAYFINGFAKVSKIIDGKNKCGFVNTQGKEVVPCVYDWYEVDQALQALKEYIEKNRNIREIPIAEYGVHETHCCKEHGCKYGNENCPVVLGVIKQKYPCEDCVKTM